MATHPIYFQGSDIPKALADALNQDSNNQVRGHILSIFETSIEQVALGDILFQINSIRMANSIVRMLIVLL